ncbi:MAG: cell division protein ZapA [bacterium]|nr:cell division protein ZapA [bacterium]
MASDASDKKQVRVTIFNQTYTLRTAGDPSETEHLANAVDELMTSVAARAGNLDSSRIAVLACLHMADRLRGLEQDLEELRNRVDRKSKDFSLLLDQAIQDEPPREEGS